MNHKELSSHELSILAQKRLARATYQAAVLKNKFGGMNDPIVKQMEKTLAHVAHNAATYLDNVLHKPEEAERIKKVVQERYHRRSKVPQKI